jgi:tetratricopeptide (TPR) repeat protein
MKQIALLITILCCFFYVDAQKILENPAIADEQTHQDLTILRVGLYSDSTVIELSIQNKLAQGGWFCADRNIYIENPKDHKRFNLIKTRGIPTCPSVHNFTRIDEKLNFYLVFPKIPAETKLINVIEDCDKSCFRFTEVILDEKLNKDIKLYTRGVDLYASNKINDAIDCFTKVVEVIPEFPTHVYGYSYFNLIRIYFNKGDKLTARYWYDQLEKSHLADKDYFINSLKKEGIQVK